MQNGYVMLEHVLMQRDHRQIFTIRQQFTKLIRTQYKRSIQTSNKRNFKIIPCKYHVRMMHQNGATNHQDGLEPEEEHQESEVKLEELLMDAVELGLFQKLNLLKNECHTIIIGKIKDLYIKISLCQTTLFLLRITETRLTLSI